MSGVFEYNVGEVLFNSRKFMDIVMSSGGDCEDVTKNVRLGHGVNGWKGCLSLPWISKSNGYSERLTGKGGLGSGIVFWPHCKELAHSVFLESLRGTANQK